MKFYTIKTPFIIQRVFSSYRWRFSSVSKEIYLTFDDGPTSEITTFILNELKKHKVKATFFCIGKNVKKHPTIYERIKKEGHSVGNHTYNHLNGFRTNNTNYIENIQQAEKLIESNLFRPPYGRLKSSQAKSIIKKGYKIIMWDVLSGDFDTTITPEKCLKNVLNKTTNGSIIVMHDSEKAKDKIFYTLPKILNYYQEKGYLFKAIS
jgi:peptidoglycan/xylan/chitin deacetylase (PgdA/CDA1 family)